MQMALIVQKYGGTSVASIDHIRRAAMGIATSKINGNKVAVVVSAMGGETDRLLDLVSQITNYPSLREQDALVATGEQVCSALMAITLEGLGHKSISMLGLQLPLITNDVYTKARILELHTENTVKV